MSGRKYGLCLGLIVALGLMARLLHHGLGGSLDEEIYILAAKLIGRPEFATFPGYGSARILWLWTLKVWGQLAGFSLASTGVLMLGFSAAEILLTAAIARRVFGRLASLLAAGVVAFYYVNVLDDPHTRPDGEAIVVLLGAVLLFLQYLETRRRAVLVVAALLTGFLLPIKEYYCLIVLPFSWSLWSAQMGSDAQARTAGRRLQDLLLAAVVFLVGVAVSPVLHYLSGKPAWFQFHGSGAEYATFLAEHAPNLFDRARMVGRQFGYVRFLLFDNGVVGGIVLVFGGFYLAALRRSRDECRLLFNTAVLFLVFLTFMPASFKPFVFIQEQVYYMMMFIPFLAVGAGGGLEALLARLKDDRFFYHCAWGMICLVAAINVWIPNYRFGSTSNGVGPGVALTQCLDHSREYGFSEILLPWNMWREELLAKYTEREVRLILAKHGNGPQAEYGDIRSQLELHPGMTVFVPASMTGDNEVVQLNCREDFRKIPLKSPSSSLSSWMSAIKNVPGDTVVAYLYVRKAKTAKP